MQFTTFTSKEIKNPEFWTGYHRKNPGIQNSGQALRVKSIRDNKILFKKSPKMGISKPRVSS